MSTEEARQEALCRYSHANVRDRYDADLMMAVMRVAVQRLRQATDGVHDPREESALPGQDAVILVSLTVPSGARSGRRTNDAVELVQGVLAERDAAVQRAEQAEAAIREALRIDTHYMHPDARRILSAALDTEKGDAS